MNRTVLAFEQGGLVHRVLNAAKTLCRRPAMVRSYLVKRDDIDCPDCLSELAAHRLRIAGSKDQL